MTASRHNSFPKSFPRAFRTVLAACVLSAALAVPPVLAIPSAATPPGDALPYPTAWVEEGYGIPNDGGVGYGSPFTLQFRGLPEKPGERNLRVAAGAWVTGQSFSVGHLAKREADGTYSLSVPSSEIAAPNQWPGIYVFELDDEVGVRLGVDTPKLVIPTEYDPGKIQVGDEVPVKIFGLEPDARFVLVAYQMDGRVINETVGPIQSGSEVEWTFPVLEDYSVHFLLYSVFGDGAQFVGTDKEKWDWLEKPGNAAPEERVGSVSVDEVPAAIGYTVSEDDSELVTLTFRNMQVMGLSEGEEIVAVASKYSSNRPYTACPPDSITFADEADGSVSATCSMRLLPSEDTKIMLYRAPAGWRDMTLQELAVAASSGAMLFSETGDWYSSRVNLAEGLRERDRHTYAITSPNIPPRALSSTSWGADGATSPYSPPAGLWTVPWNADGRNIFAGDWDGDGADTVGYRIGTNTFRFSTYADGVTTWSEPITFGRPGDQIFVGDWDGDGKETVGLRRANRVFLSNARDGGRAEIEFTYGRDGDAVIVGDWDNDGYSTLGLRRGNTMFLSNGFQGGNAEIEFTYGRVGDEIYVGDWDNDGVDSFLVRRGDALYFTNGLEGGKAERTERWGTGEEPILVGRTLAGTADFIYMLRKKVRLSPIGD